MTPNEPQQTGSVKNFNNQNGLSDGNLYNQESEDSDDSKPLEYYIKRQKLKE